MPYRQRIAFMTSLLILGLGYLYAYVPARYVAEEVRPYAELDQVNLDSGLQDEAALLRAASNNSSTDYTASVLDVLTDDTAASNTPSEGGDVQR